MAETDERVTNLFTKKSHHCNTSVIYLVAKPVSKKQGESHHQFEFTIHSGVQESARCVANDYIGQTDVPRSSQVCSGGVRRRDVNAVRVYFGRSETGHPRGSTIAHVHTTGRRCSVCIHTKSINSRAPYVTPYSHDPMRRFTINLRSCIKRVTRRDDSQSSDVWSREETRSLSSDAQQDEEYKASKGHTRTRRR